MKIGVILPQFDAGPAELLGAARLAEASGLDSVWVYDNLWGVPSRERPVLEPWVCLSLVAASTSRVTVGTLVLRTTLRNRRLLLSMTQSLEMVAPGRLILGLGIGDSRTREEQRAYGFDNPPIEERTAELERHLDLFRADLPQVPLWVGGGSRHVMSLIPKSDAWNYWGSVDGFARRLERARTLAGDRPVAMTWGAPSATPEGLQRLADLGADHAVVAVGARNFEDRIGKLASFAAR